MPETGKPKASSEAIAVSLCAAVLLKGRTAGRFVMILDELRKASDLPRDQFDAALGIAAERSWMRIDVGHVELKAAGIYVAKEDLDLPR